MEFDALGDSALLIRLENNFGQAPGETLEKILQALQRLENARIPGVREITPAYTTITVFFDAIALVENGAPVNDVVGWLREKVQGILRAPAKRRTRRAEMRMIEVPVCYDREFGFDLEELAQRANISPDDVARLHAAADYRVHCIGFTPGFGFLSGLHPKLATPRRATPRTDIPAGSVAIGGKQTGIYPIRSPGGWNIIGRTPLRMFDVEREPPTVLQTGDRVRFRAITRAEFDSLGK
jgi:inhibitor of KinA